MLYNVTLHIILLFLLIFATCLFGQDELTLSRKNGQSTSQIDSWQILNINNLSTWIRNDGLSGSAPDGEAGVYYPRRIASVSKQDGLLWGGYVQDNDPSKPILRVGGQTYISSTVSGPIVQSGPNPVAGEAMKAFRIRRDYKTLTESSIEVLLDAADVFQVDVSDVTPKQARSVINQYAYDWNNWPAQLGAPYYDNNNNGSYEPDADEPGLAEADQVIWMVTNDLDLAKSVAFAGSPPIGLEIQTTIWGYAGYRGDLVDMQFQRYRFINHSGYDIDSVYVVRWADLDIGESENDFAGCDSILGLGYAYNGEAYEPEYEIANLAPPAYGYGLLQGPLRESPGDSATFDFLRIAGYRDIGVTSFFPLSSGAPISDITFGDYEATEDYYYRFNGYIMSGHLYRPWYHGAGPLRGQPTKFLLNGDPVTQTYDVDGLEDNLYPGDRRILISSGPFYMQPGDVQEVIYSAIGGLGDTWLHSVAELKRKQRLAMALQKDRFRTIPSKTAFNWRTRYLSTGLSEVGFQVKLNNALEVFLRLQDRNEGSVAEVRLFDDGAHNDGAAGDGLWGATWQTTPRGDGLTADLQVTYSSGFQITREHIARNITTGGPVRITAVNIGSDNLNEDGQVNPGENVRFTLTLANDGNAAFEELNIYSIETLQPAYTPNFRAENGFQNFFVPGNSQFSWPYGENEPYFFMQLDAGIMGDDSLQLVFRLEDRKGAAWMDTVAVYIAALQEEPQDYLSEKTSGISDGELGYRIFDSSMINGDTYSVAFDDTNAVGEPVYTLRNDTQGQVLQQAVPYPDAFPHNSTPQDGFLITQGTTIPEDFPDRWEWEGGPRWFGGVNWGGRSFGGAIDVGKEFIGSTLSIEEVHDVAIVFDSTMQTNACVFHRSSGYNFAGIGIFPGAAYDIEDPQNPRRVNIAFVEDAGAGNLNLEWDPGNSSLGGREYLFIMKSTYDPLTAGGYYQSGMIFGDTDTQWALWPRVRFGFSFLQNPGTLKLFLKTGIRFGSVYRFTPASPLGIATPTAALTFELAQNYPNPFNPETTIKFQIPAAQKVTLQTFNVLGQKVTTLIDDQLSAGSYDMRWDGRSQLGNSVSSGVYFYRLEVGDFVKTRKMLLVR
ncbi:MAG: T9SS type A sorting domain-containing protein [Calditrichia bacterium]